MPLPNKNDNPTTENIHDLEIILQSWIIKDPKSLNQCCGFYDKFNDFVGPWPKTEYPLGYGKKYCFAFNANEKLRNNEVTWHWVKQTTINLQTALVDYVVERFKEGTLDELTPEQLKSHAFDSHPKAYDEGGLSLVVNHAPELLPVIMWIPISEFFSENYKSSFKQAFETAGLILPKASLIHLTTFPHLTAYPAASTAMSAFPAHNMIVNGPIKTGSEKMLYIQQETRRLAFLEKKVNEGKLDNLVALDNIIGQLEYKRFKDRGLRMYANRIISNARKRKRYVFEYYQSILDFD